MECSLSQTTTVKLLCGGGGAWIEKQLICVFHSGKSELIKGCDTVVELTQR